MNVNNYTKYNNIDSTNYNEDYIPHNTKEILNNIKKVHNNGGNFNSREYFNSILFVLKQLAIKIGVLLFFVIALLLFFWRITGNNIFEIIKIHF